MGTGRFSELLRAARHRRQITQERLADISGVSVRTIVEMERGRVRRPRAGSVGLLADALGLSGQSRAEFEAAARNGYWAEVSAATPTRGPAAPADVRWRSVRAAPVGSAVPVVPAQLPADVPGFAGRLAELARLDAVLARRADGGHRVGPPPTAIVIAALSGMAGVGKTALAVHWAHRVADAFPDGQLFVNLRGFDPRLPPVPPAEALRGFLDAFGIPVHRIPADLDARAALYRSVLAGHRVLVLLDNARDPAQVRPLLPGSPTSLVLVTSRDGLAGLVAAENAHPMTVDVFDPAEARQMLANRLGEDRVAAERHAVDEVVARCARLPLALAVAAAQAAREMAGGSAGRRLSPITALAARLSGAGTPPSGRDLNRTEPTGRRVLDPFDTADPVTDIRVVFSSSYAALDGDTAWVFQSCGTHPGPDLTCSALASLTAIGRDRTGAALTALTRAHLLNESEYHRYTQHDLLRAYAREVADTTRSERDRAVSRHRVLDHYLHSAHAADRMLFPHRALIPPDPALAGVTPDSPRDRDEALGWFAAERRNLVAAVHHAAEEGMHAHVWRLAWTMLDYFDRWGHWDDQADTQRLAVNAAVLSGNTWAEALCERGLGRAMGRLSRLAEAHEHLSRSVELFTALDDLAAAARTHLSLAVLAERRGQHRPALVHAQRALAWFATTGSPVGEGNALNMVGWYHALLGEYRRAVEFGLRALAVLERAGDRYGAAGTWEGLGYAYQRLAEHDQAERCYLRAVSMYRDNADHRNEADALSGLGDTYLATGRREAAHESWRQALDLLVEADDPAADALRDKLAAGSGQ